jgi:hypothetical protein
MGRGYPAIWSTLLSLPFFIAGGYVYLMPSERLQVPGASIVPPDLQLIAVSFAVFGLFLFMIGLYVQFAAPPSPSLQDGESIIEERKPSQRVALSKGVLSIPFFAVTLYLLFYTVLPYMYPTLSLFLGLYFFSAGIKTYWVNALTQYIATSKRVISVYRFISLRRQEIPINKIRRVEERKSISETLTGLGNVRITSGSGGESVQVNMKNIADSTAFDEKLRVLIDTFSEHNDSINESSEDSNTGTNTELQSAADSTTEDTPADVDQSPTDNISGTYIPDTIPQPPNVAVSYADLTSKEPIGKGGNADVTKAVLPTDDGNITLAIKEPRMAGTLHTDQAEKMLQEAETWDNLDDHDHIVGVYDYANTPVPWIAVEYMDGGHLGEQPEDMDTKQALWTAIAITKGVRHAHRRGVAHLDLKPENILFREVEDMWNVPKVADWGLSKHLLEHSKSVEGMSVEYGAPEQFDDEYGSTDDITDVYQLGAVFYELFTGCPPFEGRKFKLIDMIKNNEPTPPSEIADVPDGLDEILLTALAKEKDDRYEDILLFRNDLQELFVSLERVSEKQFSR